MDAALLDSPCLVRLPRLLPPKERAGAPTRRRPLQVFFRVPRRQRRLP